MLLCKQRGNQNNNELILMVVDSFPNIIILLF